MRLLIRASEKVGGFIYRVFKRRIFLRSAYGPWLKYRLDKTYRLSLYGQYADRVIAELELLEGNDLFLDIGANTGLFSLYASKRGKNIRIFTFEPNSSIFPLLLNNIARNKCFNIVPFNAAISDTNGEVSFMAVEKHSGKSHITNDGQSVKVLSLSKESLGFLPALNFGKCIIKIDVEGAEYVVLRQLEVFLQKHAKNCTIIVEINDEHLNRFNDTRKDIYEYMSGFGFRPRYKEDAPHFDEVFEHPEQTNNTSP